MEKQLNTKTLVERPKRVPVTGRSRLTVRNQDPNYKYRIVNANLESDPDRVLDLQERGYEIVPRGQTGGTGDKRVDDASALGSAGQISVGQGTKAVVMRIPREWYEQDQKAKQDEVDLTERRVAQDADYGKIDITSKRSG